MNATENNLSDMIKKSVQQAARLFHDGNLAACQLLIGQTLRIDSNNDEALQIAGLLKLRTGDTKDAVVFLEDARSINPNNPDHHNNLALAYSRMGKYDAAVICLQDALKMAPARQIFWINMAVQLRNQANIAGRADREELLNESEAALHKAMEIGPESTSAYANLGSLLAERHDLEESES